MTKTIIAFLLAITSLAFLQFASTSCSRPAKSQDSPNRQLITYMVDTKQGGTKYVGLYLDGPNVTMGMINAIQNHASLDTNLVATNFVIINVVPIY